MVANPESWIGKLLKTKVDEIMGRFKKQKKEGRVGVT